MLLINRLMRIKVLLAKLLKTFPKLRNKTQWNLSYADAKKKPWTQGFRSQRVRLLRSPCSLFCFKSWRLMLMSSVTVTSLFYICLFFVSETQCKWSLSHVVTCRCSAHSSSDELYWNKHKNWCKNPLKGKFYRMRVLRVVKFLILSRFHTRKLHSVSIPNRFYMTVELPFRTHQFFKEI